MIENSVEQRDPRYSVPSSEEQAEYDARLPEIEAAIAQPAQLIECGPQIAEIEALMVAFEATHDLAALHAITTITLADAMEHPLRKPAKVALIPIVALLTSLKCNTNITEERLEELKQKYLRLSRAVGMFNQGVLDHTRG